MDHVSVSLPKSRFATYAPWIIDLLCAVMILLFLYTGLSKVLDHRMTTYQMQESPWGLVAQHAALFAWAVPVWELLLSALLLVPVTRAVGLYLSAGTMLAFTLYVLILLSSNVKLPCSCGGIMAKLTWTQHLFVNILFFLIAITAIVFIRKVRKF